MRYLVVCLALPLFMFSGTLGSYAIAQSSIYSKCRTINGTIIVVQGNRCPSGTLWVGRA